MPARRSHPVCTCRPSGCWLERDKRSERRLRIWVADVAMSEMKMPAWPLLKGGRVDLFGALPFALNARGPDSAMWLAFTNVLVGATADG